MNMNYVTWIVVAIVVVAAGYFLFMRAPAPQAPANEQGAAAGTAISRQGSGSFNDLMALGGSYECRISTTVQGVASEGTVYISGSDIRGDFSATVGDQTVSSSMLQSGGYIYTWSDMMPQGFKMAVDTSAAAGAPAQGSYFDPQVGVTYDCKPWVASAATFAVPADITFMEAPSAQ